MAIWLPFQCQTKCPVEDGCFYTSCRTTFLDNSVVEFFEQSRHRGEDRWLRITQVFFDGFQTLCKIDVGTDVHVQIVQHAFEDVANGKEAQYPVFLIDQDLGNPWNAVQNVLHDVLMAEHHTLRSTGGARSVYDGREVCGFYTCHATLQFALLLVASRLGDFRPVRAIGFSLKNKDALQRGDFVFDGHDFVVQFLVADRAVFALTVGEDVFIIRLGHGGVNRHVDPAGRHDSVVHDVPFTPIVV